MPQVSAKLYKRFSKPLRSRGFEGIPFHLRSNLLSAIQICTVWNGCSSLVKKRVLKDNRWINDPKPTALSYPANPEMQVNDPFEKQQQTRARLVCQATQGTCDRLQSPHPGTLVSQSGPRGDPTRGILYTPAAGVQDCLLLESAGLGGGGAGWPAAVRILCGPPRAPGAPGWGPRASRPRVVGGTGPALGAHAPQALPQRRPAGTRRRREAPWPMGTGRVST